MKAINFFLTTIFRTGLQPYLKLATAGMTRNTLIKHKELVVICEESRLVITNYDTLIIQPLSKPVTWPIVTYTTSKQQLTRSNYGKTNHAKKTCHNGKREEVAFPIVPTKVVEPVTKVIAQLVKLAIML